ncbi:LD-carboxypeptidase [Xenorhabdus miraniensis]
MIITLLKIKKDQEIIIGYSDITVLLLGIYSKTDVVTFYGPMLGRAN